MSGYTRDQLRASLLDMTAGESRYVRAARFWYARRVGTWGVPDDTWDIWAPGQCRCERAARAALDIEAATDHLLPYYQDPAPEGHA